ASFQILLPISYLLIISPILLLFSEIRKFLILMSLIVAFCFSFFDIKSVNFGLGIIGIIGIYIGMVINRLEFSFFIKSRLIILFCLIICIFFMEYLDRNVMTYSIGIMIVSKLFYDLGMTSNLLNNINKSIILFGQYSLFCYLIQIIIIHILARTFS